MWDIWCQASCSIRKSRFYSIDGFTAILIKTAFLISVIYLFPHSFLSLSWRGNYKSNIKHHHIFPSFPSFHLCVTLPPAAAVGPVGVRLHVYYIHFGQYIHPIGSDRRQWAAGEYSYFLGYKKTHRVLGEIRKAFLFEILRGCRPVQIFRHTLSHRTCLKSSGQVRGVYDNVCGEGGLGIDTWGFEQNMGEGSVQKDMRGPGFTEVFHSSPTSRLASHLKIKI